MTACVQEHVDTAAAAGLTYGCHQTGTVPPDERLIGETFFLNLKDTDSVTGMPAHSSRAGLGKMSTGSLYFSLRGLTPSFFFEVFGV